MEDELDAINDAYCDYAITSDYYYMHDEVEQLKAENAELRELAKDACTVLRGFFDPEWFDETVLAERMHKLGIKIETDDD